MTQTTVAMLTKGQTFFVQTKAGRLVEYIMMVEPTQFCTYCTNVLAQSVTHFALTQTVFVAQ